MYGLIMALILLFFDFFVVTVFIYTAWWIWKMKKDSHVWAIFLFVFSIMFLALTVYSFVRGDITWQ